MREQIEILSTEQTAVNRPLTDAELNVVSGGWWEGGYTGGTGEPLWQGYTQNITYLNGQSTFMSW